MLKSFKQRNTWDLIWQLFRTDFKLKYNDSILGFIWVLVKPFTIFGIMYFVMSKIFPNPALYLLLGNMFMTFWTESTTQGMESLLSRAGLITKINFPRYIVLISATLLSLVNFLINLSIFVIILLFNDVNTSFISVLWFIFCIVMVYLLTLVISMFLSITYVKFRDLKQIWELFNQIIFWSTPIFYNIDALANKSKVLNLILTKLNPLSVFLTSGRSAILEDKIIFKPQVFVWCGITFFVGILGYLYYKRSIKRIAEFF